MKKWLVFLLVLACLIILGMNAPFDKTWYDTLNKPNITPPNFVFPIVWTLLYVCLAINFTWIFFTKTLLSKRFYYVTFILTVLFIQLFSIFEFKNHDLLLALLDIIFLLLSTILLYFSSSTINKKAALFIIPLLLWVMYAAFIQVGLIRLNQELIVSNLFFK